MIAASTSDAGFKARQAAVDRWRRRSRIVAVWRIVLPLSIAAIVLAMGGWIVARTLLAGPVPQVAAPDRVSMTAPRVYGVDGRDRTYVLAAKAAVRDDSGKSRLILEEPTFNLGAGKVRAREGIMEEGSTNIILRGNVLLVSGSGERMETQEALINTRTGTITNRSSPEGGRVEIESRSGKISANDYSIGKNGDVSFRGRVRGVINAK